MLYDILNHEDKVWICIRDNKFMITPDNLSKAYQIKTITDLKPLIKTKIQKQIYNHLLQNGNNIYLIAALLN